MPLDRAWAELRAHAGTQFDPEIVSVFEQVVREDGTLRPLDPSVECTLDSEVHVPMVASSPESSWQARLAVLPVMEPLHVPARPAIKAQPEDCPVAPVGEECAVIASGEGCELVLPQAGPTARADVA
jgi:hypothetical protein